MSNRVVIDASVVLKWLLNDEECVSQAVGIRDAHLIYKEMQLVAPELMIYEIANGLVMATRRERLSPVQAREGLVAILDVGIQVTSADAERTLNLAEKHTLTAYDAAYIVVAEAEACPFWTADAVLYEAVREQLAWVRWIGDYESVGRHD